MPEFEIEPAAKFKSCLGKPARQRKPRVSVQGDAGGVGSVDGAHQEVQITGLRLLDDRCEQAATDPLPPAISRNINRMLGRVFVGGEVAKRAPGGKAGQRSAAS